MTFENHYSDIAHYIYKLEQAMKAAHDDGYRVNIDSTCNPANTTGSKYISISLSKGVRYD